MAEISNTSKAPEDHGYDNSAHKCISGNSKPRYSTSNGESSWVPICFSCEIKGHKANECPSKTKPRQVKSNQDKAVNVKRVIVIPSIEVPHYVEVLSLTKRTFGENWEGRKCPTTGQM